MNLTHWVKKENSGLFRSTLELAVYEEKQGHNVTLKQPSGDNRLLYGEDLEPHIELIHSQMPLESYHNGKPKIMWMHGEPLSSVGNKVSMTAITELAPAVDAFICMRREEKIIWDSIKRTWLVPKGIDLERYKPEPVKEKLSGNPAVIYVENWRRQRNPLYVCVAMQEVWKKYPEARLHLFNCPDKKLGDMFKGLIANNHWWSFIRTLNGPQSADSINGLYNKADIVVSGLYPLYARGIEAFGAGKAFIGPGYREPGYPWVCELQPESMARAIINCWENYGRIDYRKWAEDNHDVAETVRQSVEIYERYI
jgi:glycosyltransferase involved in cell wall biosynthesis